MTDQITINGFGTGTRAEIEHHLAQLVDERNAAQAEAREALDKTTRDLVTANGRAGSLQTALDDALDAHRRSIREAADRIDPAVVALFEAIRPLLDEVVETAVKTAVESAVESAVDLAVDLALDLALSDLSVEPDRTP
jgi:hypothetical protein